MDRDTIGKIGAFVGGVAVGSLLGILFAPASGKETREKIKENFQGLEDQAKEKFQKVREYASEAIERGKEAFKKETEQEG